MRSYGKNWTYKQTATYKVRQTRLATEWDIRLDVGDELTVETILNHLRAANDGLLYVAMSGIERPDKAFSTTTNVRGEQIKYNAGSVSSGEHVHLCIVSLLPLDRPSVLRMVRGPRKVLDEYAAPRNAKFSYAGWLIHHAKPDYKIPNQPDILYERGTLPMDPMTTDWALKIKSMITKFKPNDGVRNRFKPYMNLLETEGIKAKIEQLQMQLEDHDTN